MKIRKISSNLTFQSKEDIKRKKKFKRRIFWIKFILFSILISTSVILLALSSIFNIRTIEVSGAAHYRQDEIIASTDIVKGENGFKSIGSNIFNVFTLRYGKAENAIIKNHPYIKSVEVKFVLPSKISINIIERTPIAFIKSNGKNILIDREAYVVDSRAGINVKNMIEIRGIKIGQVVLGQKLNMDNPEYINYFNETLEAIKTSDETGNYKIYKSIDYVDVSELTRVILSVESRIRANLGGLDDLNYKLSFLKTVLKENNKKEKGFLDLTVDNPGRVLSPE